MDLVLAAAFGVLIGLAVGTVGGGGSVLAVPVLVYVLAEPVHDATTAALLVVAVGAAAGAVGQARAGMVCWRCAASIAPAAALGTLAGAYANKAASDDVLLLALVPFMSFAAIATWRNAGRPEGKVMACPNIKPLTGTAVGLAVGILTGFLGVGGGFLIVPLLLFALDFPLRRAVGTSLVVVGVVSLASLISHLIAGSTLNAPIAAAMAVGCAVGAAAGTAIGHTLPRAALGRGFAGLVIAVAAWLLISTAFLGGPPA